MKTRLLIGLFFLLLCNCSNAQIWRQVKDRIKNKVEQKVLQKAEQSVDNAIDSIGKKKKTVMQEVEQEPGATQVFVTSQMADIPTTNPVVDTVPEPQTIIEEEKKEAGNEVTQQEGFISITLSADKIFTGGIIYISGKSVLYKDYKTMELTITGKGYSEKKTVALITGGTYNSIWNVPVAEGEYTITAISSDKKATASKKVTVYELPELEEMAKGNVEETNKAFEKVKERIDKVKGMLSTTQASELEKKLKDVAVKKDAAIKFFNSVNDSNKRLAQMAKKGKTLPRNLSQNLSELNQHLKKQSDEMKQMQEFINHEPADNSICEYLVMINEACAAFSTFSAFWEKSVQAVLTNIVLDKVPPAVVGKGNEMVGKPIPEPADFIPKETSKLFVTAMVDCESMITIKGKTGIAGDLISFITDILMKMFCGVYKGEMTHTYSMIFKNKDGKTYWRYGVEMKAVVNLRYPKNSSKGKIIKMKGAFEGNATAFSFFANPKEAMAEELKANGRYNMVETFTILDIPPVAIPFSAAQQDIYGFGAIARAGATPASFYIPVDAEYNQDNHQIKFFINPALNDFSPLVKNTQLYVILAVLPMCRVENYPVEKAQKTIKGSLKEKNYFIMTGEAEGKPRFEGTINRKIKDPEFEIDLKIYMKVAKD